MTFRWTGTVHRRILPNGLTVLVQRDDSAPVAGVVTHLKAGFFDEPDRWAGISHVLEHMYFKGTGRRAPGEIARETKAAGGYLNAYTSYDQTVYYVVLPAGKLETALDIQADALQHSVIDAGELAREIQVIIQEASRKLDTPSAVTWETLHEVMYDRHRIRRWRIGLPEALAGFTRDDVYGYYASRYVPSRAIVAVVGDVDPERVMGMVDRAYGAWPDRNVAPDQGPEEPPRREVRFRTLRGDVTHGHLALGWRAVPPLHPDAPALDLAAAVMSLGRGSWLYRSLRQTGLATSASAYYYAPTELGYFAAGAEFEPRNLAAVAGELAGAARRMVDQGPGEADLERARAVLLTRWARRLEPADGRGTALTGAEALKHVSYLDQEYDALASVSAGQVREAARRYLDPEALSAVAFLPEGEGEDLGREQLLAQRPAPAAPVPLEPARYAAPGAGRRSERARVAHLSLPGADILVRRKTGVPSVTVGTYLPRSSGEPPELAGISSLGLRSSVRGAGGADGPALAFALERLGGSLSTSSASDWVGLATAVLPEHLAEAASLLRLVLLEPDLRDVDLVTERGLMVEEALQLADDMFRYPFQLAFRSAFGDVGYGLPVGGLPETLREISPARAREYHRGVLERVRPVVIAVGDVDPQAALDSLGQVFGGLSYRHAMSSRTRQDWAVSPGHPASRVIERQKNQSAVAMTFPGPTRGEPERHAAEVWSAVAGGLGGRLFESLRSRRSLAYTVVAASWQRARAGALVTYIATAPEREAEARDAMLEELAVFTREPVSDTELRQAASYLAGQTEINQQTASALIAEILEAWVLGGGLEDLEDPAGPYRRVSAEDVLQVARACLRPGIRAEGVVRGGKGEK
ncbi:MAG: M16 family metallopeptidase [Gemmatimonadales bacterium]